MMCAHVWNQAYWQIVWDPHRGQHVFRCRRCGEVDSTTPTAPPKK